VGERRPADLGPPEIDSQEIVFPERGEIVTLLDSPNKGRHRACDQLPLLVMFRHGLRVSERTPSAKS
jgi:ribosomal protein S4E